MKLMVDQQLLNSWSQRSPRVFALTCGKSRGPNWVGQSSPGRMSSFSALQGVRTVKTEVWATLVAVDSIVGCMVCVSTRIVRLARWILW